MTVESNSKLCNSGNFIVALIDLLGQGNRLQGWNRMPETNQEKSAFDKAIQETVGAVDQVRKTMEFWMKKPSQPVTRQARELSGQEKMKFLALSRGEVTCQHFSDTTIAFSCMDDEVTTLNGIEGILSGCAANQLSQLALGNVPRGAVDIGMGTDFFQGEIYGPVLETVHSLEKTVADYPRIVVGSSIIDYLQQYLGTEQASEEGIYCRGVANLCTGLIARDLDGVPFVHFLGETFKQIASGKNNSIGELAKMGYRFVSKEHERHAREGNWKLAGRYGRLWQYYEQQQHVWTA